MRLDLTRTIPIRLLEVGTVVGDRAAFCFEDNHAESLDQGDEIDFNITIFAIREAHIAQNRIFRAKSRVEGVKKSLLGVVLLSVIFGPDARWHGVMLVGEEEFGERWRTGHQIGVH